MDMSQVNDSSPKSENNLSFVAIKQVSNLNDF